MDSDPHLQKQLHLNHRQPPPAQQQQQQQQIMSSGNSGGLTRYRSAPSSYFASLMSGGSYGAGGDDDCDQFLDMPETERFFSRYMSEVGGGATESSSSQNLCQIGGNEPQFVNSPLKLEQEDQIRSQTQQLQQPPPTPQQQPQMVFRSPNQLGQQNSVTSTSALDDSLMAVSSMAMNRLPPMKIGGGSSSNLIRQSSSPAGFLSQLNLDNGFSVLRAMESFGGGRGSGGMDPSFSSANRLKNHINYSTGSASPLLNPIPENGGKIMGMSSPPGDGSFGVTHSKDDSYAARFASGAWDDSILSDDFLKELGDGDRNAFSTLMSDNQRDEGGNRNPPALAHQLSLPTSLAEMSAMDKLLFQDSVPLKIRAKRGCATHPRSIAERVRRTRISERMRKLQELVPNMDKQTNTADMLDLAVDYIKDLQKKVETLSDTHSKCTCPNKQKL